MNDLPPEVLSWLEEQFGSVGVVAPVGGGCVNPAARVRLAGGEAFLKYNRRAPPGMFTAEARALRALRSAASPLRIPEVLGLFETGSAGPGIGCLLLEWLESGPPGRGFGEKLGSGLAALHATRGAWGAEAPGFIGPLPLSNETAATWAEFWWSRRLEPQLRRARGSGSAPGSPAEWEALRDRLPALLTAADHEGASLLHGDLWSGNVLAVASGGSAQPALVDPATYHGHREVDLAMAELFGGFEPSFYAAYRERWPLQPGYEEARRPVYQLFYLLVHVNLFGGGYVVGVERALREALRAR